MENDGRQRLRLGKQHNPSIFCKELHKAFLEIPSLKATRPKLSGINLRIIAETSASTEAVRQSAENTRTVSTPRPTRKPT
jgi:hypothetical protein